MKWLCLILILPTVYTQASFGKSYLGRSRLCHQWDHLNQKLGLPDSLPPKDQFATVLQGLLPQGAWQGVVGTALQACYENRTRRYTNTCPGQALWHCTVEQLIENCIEESSRKNDACSPIGSLAGLKYMFSQSMYVDMEKNLPRERRPTWFLKNYFDSKCCNLPELFSPALLAECGFTTFMNYQVHAPRYTSPVEDDGSKSRMEVAPAERTNTGDTLRVVDFAKLEKTPDDSSSVDPLDCCDMSDFVQPSWRSECDFHLTWEGQDRLVIRNDSEITTEPPTTTARPEEPKDLMLLPDTCEKETCVFSKLNLITDLGNVDRDAFSKLLDNFTAAHPSWTSAKARVVTKCLIRDRLPEYQDQKCDLNRVLACTFDVLSENCPYTRKSDLCKLHWPWSQDDWCCEVAPLLAYQQHQSACDHGQCNLVETSSKRHRRHMASCQISTSKYRPKNRREVCILPELVHRDYLAGCGLNALGRVELVSEPKRKKHGWASTKYACKNPTSSTDCLMNKMNIKNKYNFLDYFKMKDRIRNFTGTHPEWSGLAEVYMSAVSNMPMYREHCSSSKKLLNVMDAMMMTCPITKRRNTPQCQKIFGEMTNTAPLNQNVTKQNFDTILKHFHHVFLPEPVVTPRYRRITGHKRPKILRKPIYNYGLLNSKSTPKVKVVDLKKSGSKKFVANYYSKPLVILPVYLKIKPSNAEKPFNNDGVLRSDPFLLHSQIAQAHNSTSTKPNGVDDPTSTAKANSHPVETIIPLKLSNR